MVRTRFPCIQPGGPIAQDSRFTRYPYLNVVYGVGADKRNAGIAIKLRDLG
jgi:hypothetical protein